MAETSVPVPTTTTDSEAKQSPDVPHKRAPRRISKAGDTSFHPGALELFSRPCQRQKWGDTQILPRTNWGDLFFDLFYVAAAYNIGNILVASPTGTGALYFIGTFLPVFSMWSVKGFYDARYVVGDDLFHRFFEVAVLLAVSTAVLHIRPVAVMSNSADHVDMFAFALALLLSSTLDSYRYIETYFFGRGQRSVIKQTSVRDLRHGLKSVVFYLAATIVAGINFYSTNNDNNTSTAGDGTSSAASYTDDHRFLAKVETTANYSSTSANTTNIPIILCLVGPIATYLYQCVTVVFLFPNDGSHKQFTIPLNIDFVIHRNGEWIMLMLGESILSLLIVDAPEGSDYYLTFYSGILTVILLQYLHYRSQPHHADDHAMRRDKNAAMMWRGVFMIYSAALVCVGVSYKLFMYEFTYQDQERRLEEVEEDRWGEAQVETSERFLAGGGSSSGLSTEQRRQNTANLFCMAMALIWFCQDAMLFLHSGFRTMQGRCYCEHSHKVKLKAAILLTLRVCLLVFIATLSQYETDPDRLALCGLAGVIGQLILRVIGTVVFPQKACDGTVEDEEQAKENDDNDINKEEPEIDPEENKWPNVTHAAVEKAESGAED